MFVMTLMMTIQIESINNNGSENKKDNKKNDRRLIPRFTAPLPLVVELGSLCLTFRVFMVMYANMHRKRVNYMAQLLTQKNRCINTGTYKLIMIMFQTYKIIMPLQLINFEQPGLYSLCFACVKM